MATSYLHNHKAFPDLLRIVEEDKNINAYLVEKDYWLMHVLHGLQKCDLDFKLKGGTSLSKGFNIIDRFSEDIDIYIKPSPSLAINEGSTTASNANKRKEFYDSLVNKIKIDGITEVVRDHEFDDEAYYRSGGIRLKYESKTTKIQGIKDGILLEAGFDKVTPDIQKDITSWALEKAKASPDVEFIDNTAIQVSCYHPGYTIVEKLQTIATKFRREQETGIANVNFMRQYYDVAQLLQNDLVRNFIGTAEYLEHKKNRFPKKDLEIPINENQAFLLSDGNQLVEFKKRYELTERLYYKGQPPFEDLIAIIAKNIDKL